MSPNQKQNFRRAWLMLSLTSILWAFDAAMAGEPLVVHPKPIETHLRNPYMGFVYCGSYQPNVEPTDRSAPQLADVYYVSATWGDLEPQEGHYNWEYRTLRGGIQRAIAEGRRVAIRVGTSWNNVEYPTPKWVFDVGVKRLDVDRKKSQEATMVGGLFTVFVEPEWWNPIYIKKYCTFVEAMGKEFDGQPWLDYMDIRCYGLWGEGHRWQSVVPWPDDVGKREVIKTLIDAHLRAFKKTPLVVEMASDKDTPYPEGTAIDYALDHGCWMRRDGFGPYINDDEERIMKEWFPRSLVIAEQGNPLRDLVRGRIKKTWVPGAQPITLDAMYDQILDFHANYVPLGVDDRDWDVLRCRPDLLKKLWMKMGYRFVITEAKYTPQVSPGGRLKVELEWENVGVGRLPAAYPLAFYLANVEGRFVEVLRDNSFDETSWLAGKRHRFTHSIDVSAETGPGEYYLAVALVERSSGEPAIALGIEGDDFKHRYVLGSVTITATP